VAVSGLGLKTKMTASYVLVTSAVVVLVGAVVLVVVLPRLLSGADVGARVRATATDDAGVLTRIAGRYGRLPTAGEIKDEPSPSASGPICDPELSLRPGQARATANGVAIPCLQGTKDGSKPMSLMVLVAPSGTVVATSYPSRYPVRGRASDLLPAASLDRLGHGAPAGGGIARTGQGSVLWAVAPVMPFGTRKPPGTGKPPGQAPIGYVYVQVPASGGIAGPSARDLLALVVPGAVQSLGGLAPDLGGAGPLLQLGLALLLVTVPVGMALGLLSTRRLIRRLRRLASTTVRVAQGDFEDRVPVTGGDEVAELERSFNRVAERLSRAVAAQRQLADASTHHADRSWIARDLHDSVSQDLFSLSVLAGGLRKALPAGSPLQVGVEAMESTASGAMQEMQALLLELRPVALEDAGLLPALEELCRAYRARFGVAVETDLEAVELPPPVEHAVLRVAQEALANAVKHGSPRRIALRVALAYRKVEVEVRDDGRGFEPESAASRRGLGLELMRERVSELGGTLRLESRPGQGTRLRVLLPRG